MCLDFIFKYLLYSTYFLMIIGTQIPEQNKIYMFSNWELIITDIDVIVFILQFVKMH